VGLGERKIKPGAVSVPDSHHLPCLLAFRTHLFDPQVSSDTVIEMDNVIAGTETPPFRGKGSSHKPPAGTGNPIAGEDLAVGHGNQPRLLPDEAFAENSHVQGTIGPGDDPSFLKDFFEAFLLAPVPVIDFYPQTLFPPFRESFEEGEFPRLR